MSKMAAKRTVQSKGVGRAPLWAAAILATWAAARPAPAATINVTTRTAPATAGDGQCGLLEAIYASQYRTARDACPAGSGVDTIRLSTGTYTVPSAIEVWSDNLTIVGVAMGSTTISSSSVAAPSFPTGLQPDDCSGRSAAVYVSTSATMAFTDLTLQPAAGVDTIGICHASGSLALTRVRVTGFESRGILSLYAPNSNGTDVSLSVISSTIDNNHAYNDGLGGAGIYYRSDGIDGFGNILGGFAVSSSTINNNFSEDGGGGISFESTSGMTATITSSIITANTALMGGGGIAAGRAAGQFDGESFHIDITATSVSNNSSGTDGGGIWMGGNGSGTQSHILSSAITGNHATGRGGGFYSSGQPYLTNTTIGGNAGVQGAGMFHEAAESYITQCTIANNGNGNTQEGGGLYAAGGSKIYGQSIFANNTAVLYSDIKTIGPVSNFYNLVRITSGYDPVNVGTDVLGQDPQLGALQNVGGPTSVYPLLAGSPAIDRIPLSPVQMGDLALDQRGSPRPQNGDDGAGRNGYDIGAFEQGPVEAEFLAVGAKTSGVTHGLITGDSNYSNSKGTRLQATSNGQFVTYAFPIVQAGTYSFVVSVRKGNDRGIYQVATANTLTGTYTDRGGAQDLYSSSAQNAALTLGGATVAFSTSGTKYVRFTVTGKNSSSSSRNLYLDRIQLKKQ